MMMRWTTAAALTSVVWISGAYAQVDENAKAVLNRATNALQQARTLEFNAHRYATGPLQGLVDFEGRVEMVRTAMDKDRTPMRMKGVSRALGSPEKKFHVFLDGSGFVTWVDESAKKVYEAPMTIASASREQAQDARNLIIDELFKANPFEQEMAAERLEYVGRDEIRGQEVELVRAVVGNGKTHKNWAFGVDDALPRKMELAAVEEGNTVLAMVVEMWDVKANSGFSRETLAIATPAGFERESQRPQAAAQGEAAPPPVFGVAPGQDAPRFSLRSSTGQQVSLDDLKGNVVVVGFWGTWNGSSTRAMPVLDEVAKAFTGREVKVMGAAVQRDRGDEAAVAHFTEKNISIPLLLGAEEVARSYQVRGYPSIAVIGKDGKMVEFVQGMPGENALRDRLMGAIQTAIEQN